jgi:hypothetical protein
MRWDEMRQSVPIPGRKGLGTPSMMMKERIAFIHGHVDGYAMQVLLLTGPA